MIRSFINIVKVRDHNDMSYIFVDQINMIILARIIYLQVMLAWLIQTPADV